jgi:hypothetical protein
VPEVVNGQAIAGRQPKREGLSPLVKISHAEMMGSGHELRQDCPPFIRNRLGWLDSKDDRPGNRFIPFSSQRADVVFG